MEKQIVLLIDDETARRLQIVADDCHTSPELIAASLLHDVLKDDEDHHYLLEAEARSPAIN